MKPDSLTSHQILPDGSVAFATRPRLAVTCPHCWTDQRSNRDICYRCGISFHYLDEQPSADLERVVIHGRTYPDESEGQRPRTLRRRF